jgi:hypothetical protein
VGELLPVMHEVLSSIPSTEKTKNSFWQYWGLKSGSTPQAPPALFCDAFSPDRVS